MKTLDLLEACELREAIDAVLGSLTLKEREIVKLRYGLGDDSEVCTLLEVGRRLGMTRGRVRAIQNRAIGKMQHPTRLEKLLKVTDSEPR